MLMGKESLLGLFLLVSLSSNAQIYYSYDSRGNLVSMRGSSWGVSTPQNANSEENVVDTTHISISYHASSCKVQVSVFDNQDAPTTLRIYDGYNNQLLDTKTHAEASFEYDLSHLPAGLYVIEAVCLQERKNIKIQK